MIHEYQVYITTFVVGGSHVGSVRIPAICVVSFLLCRSINIFC